MRLGLPDLEELRRVYREDLETCFPPDELKPLSMIEEPYAKGRYQPWCLYDDDGTVAGECFLWLGSPGWALLDYLCVTPGKQNCGLGTFMLSEMRKLADWSGILVECEAPADSADPDLARRRLNFYARSGTKMAGYDTALFGVHYKTLYWAAEPVSDAVLLVEHQYIYNVEQMPKNYQKFFQIPYTGGQK